ncbi:hypothetical protein NE579_16315, partial [Intestinimonas massiliensis]
FDAAMIFPMIVGKLVGGVTAVAAAMLLTRKEAYHFQMWQYTSKGSVDGIQGNVDMNLWFGA